MIIDGSFEFLVPSLSNLWKARWKFLWMRKMIHGSEVKWSEVAQSCPTLCHPMDCSLGYKCKRCNINMLTQLRLPFLRSFFYKILSAYWLLSSTFRSITFSSRLLNMVTESDDCNDRSFLINRIIILIIYHMPWLEYPNFIRILTLGVKTSNFLKYHF